MDSAGAIAGWFLSLDQESLCGPRTKRRFTSDELADVMAAQALLGDQAIRFTGERDVDWPALCRAVSLEFTKIVDSRRDLLHHDSPDFAQHARVYVGSILMLCIRMRWAREQWIRRIFMDLCIQHGVATAVELAMKLIPAMEGGSSLCYIGFSLSVKKVYLGTVLERSCLHRFKDHWSDTRQHMLSKEDTTSLKYSYMANHGGPAAWFFLPIIVLPGVTTQAQLNVFNGDIS